MPTGVENVAMFATTWHSGLIISRSEMYIDFLPVLTFSLLAMSQIGNKVFTSAQMLISNDWICYFHIHL